jgi:hypothetical protein
VSDEVDDDEPRQAVLVGKGRPDPLNQTILVSVGDVVEVSYKNAKAVLPVGRPSNEDGPKAIRYVDLHVRIGHIDTNMNGFPDAGEAVSRSVVEAQIRMAQERWAQAGIVIRPHIPLNLSDFIIPSSCLDPAGDFVVTETETKDLGLGFGAIGNRVANTPGVLDLSPPAEGSAITVYFVNRLALDENNLRPIGEAFPPVRLKLARDAREKLKDGDERAGDPDLAKVIFIGSRKPPEIEIPDIAILGHELGHILVNTNDSIQARQVLFPAVIRPPVDLTVNGPKRLSTGRPESRPTNREHRHLHTFLGVLPGGEPDFDFEIVRDLDVPAMARRVRPEADYTARGNTFLKKQ